MKKSEEIRLLLKDLINEFENTWGNKKREECTLEKLLGLEWMKDGSFYLKNEKDVKELKEIYFSYNHLSFTSERLGGGYYVIHEPFSSQSSPDFLFITPIGIIALEEKKNNRGTIEWNSGTPGEDKIITYFDNKSKKVYLFTSEEYKWTKEISEEYVLFKEERREIEKVAFQDRFSKYGKDFPKFEFYMRAHLIDKHDIINEIYDPSETNVKIYLEKFFDGEISTTQQTTTSLRKEYIQGKLF